MNVAHRLASALFLAFTALAAPLTARTQPLPSAAPETVGMSADRLRRIDAFFAAEIERRRVPGAVVAIARQGKLVYFKAFGQADPVAGLPMRTDTIFQLASMTKIQAAVGALALTEQGRLPLQGRLADHFPAFAEARVGVPTPDGKFTLEPQRRPILVHDLFRHTAGMTYGGRPDSTSPIAANIIQPSSPRSPSRSISPPAMGSSSRSLSVRREDSIYSTFAPPPPTGAAVLSK